MSIEAIVENTMPSVYCSPCRFQGRTRRADWRIGPVEGGRILTHAQGSTHDLCHEHALEMLRSLPTELREALVGHQAVGASGGTQTATAATATGGAYACQHCDATFKTVDELVDHLATKPHCAECHRAFDSETALKAHNARRHAAVKPAGGRPRRQSKARARAKAS